MRTAIYPGSFDPITLGHLNLIKRASKTFDKVIVCVMRNGSKNPLFSADERLEQVKRVTAKFGNVEVDSYEGLIADYARQCGANVLIRGLRALTDFESECMMAIVNKKLYPELETLFLAADEKYMYHSSSGAKELARFGADLRQWCPWEVIGELETRIKGESK
ncbi:MAG: pantetheine-phosphate adenylyltransferase [Oscillospiraceae bacterium]|jgi:pantetheine-phosphate adenylyltransferase|nr:pantetheine-phosphate adenylyltransferase [Oscillospiraceae bacterium]